MSQNAASGIAITTHQFTVTEEVDPISVDGLPVLGPGERGHWVALDGRGDPELLTLVHTDIAKWAGKGGDALGHALLHAGLDGHVGGAAGVTLAVVSHGGVGA